MLNTPHLSRIDLNLLVLFEAVLEERHVGRAAARLHVSASAVSHGLGRLRRLMKDPLFLRQPKGVVPTQRALLLAGPIADILTRARQVLATAEPFDPRKSERRFVIGAPDAVSSVLLPPLLDEIRRSAPGIDLAVRNLVGQFETAFTELDGRTLDVAIVPLQQFPARFVARKLYDEDFVIVSAANNSLGQKVTLPRYCAAPHLVVSVSGDPHGFVDNSLAERGLKRRVVLTVSNFMQAMAIVAESDLVAAMPRTFVKRYAKQFGLRSAEPPFPMGSAPIHAVAPRVATTDAGLDWLLDELARTGQQIKPPRAKR
jgi:DNA-binding transcriptional LysR family regulator